MVSRVLLFRDPDLLVIDGANRNDSILLEPTLKAVADRGLRPDVQTLHLDRGYDSNLTTERCHNLGLTDIRLRQEEAQGRDRGQKAAHPRSAMAGRTHQLLVSNFSQLRRNTDPYPEQRLGQNALAIALILTVKLVKWAKRWTDYTPLSARWRYFSSEGAISRGERLVGTISRQPSAVSRCSCRRTCCSAPGRQP